MARGIRLPAATKNGRLAKLAGDDYIDQLVRTALLGMDSDNPFQTIGLGEWMIFGINDSMTEGEIKEAVIQIFRSFQADQLAKLKDEAAVTFKHGDGELTMTLTYINMETQEGQDIEVPIPPAGE